jgi:hypothetical protein
MMKQCVYMYVCMYVVMHVSTYVYIFSFDGIFSNLGSSIIFFHTEPLNIFHLSLLKVNNCFKQTKVHKAIGAITGINGF